MTGKFLWGIAVALSALLLLSGTVLGAAEKVYINGIDANFPPFSFLDPYGVPDGFDVKALDWIAKEMKFRVKHRAVDWDEIISLLKAKEIDIVASGLRITPKLSREVSFSIPYWTIKQVLVVKKDSRLTADRALGNGNKIGVVRGTLEAKWIQENLIQRAGKAFELVQYDSAALAVDEMVDGRITAAAMEDGTALDITRKRPVEILGGFGMEDEEFGYAARKEDQELLKKINEGLKRLMKSLYWAELTKKYIEK